MAGTLEITDSLCWMPANWVFDNALERTSSVVESKDGGLARTLAEASASGRYLDFRNAPKEHVALLAEAATTVLRDIERAAPSAFHDREYYEGFVDRIRELRQMLLAASLEA